MYVCAYVTYVCMYECMFACNVVCMYVCMYVLCMYVCIYVCINVCECMYACKMQMTSHIVLLKKETGIFTFAVIFSAEEALLVREDAVTYEELCKSPS